MLFFPSPIQSNTVVSPKALLCHNGPDPPHGDPGDALLEDPQAAAPPPGPLVQAVASTTLHPHHPHNKVHLRHRGLECEAGVVVQDDGANTLRILFIRDHEGRAPILDEREADHE